MDYITSLLQRITRVFNGTTNLELVGTYHHKPTTPQVNFTAIENHQKTLRVAMKQYLYQHEIDFIINQNRRTQASEDAIYHDFFSGDVEHGAYPSDPSAQMAVEIGLEAMHNAFKPPQKCLPAHLNDVEHHYPYKWQTNAEPPFSTDDYFLNNRKTFGEFYDPDAQSWHKYVNPVDALRRYGPTPNESTLTQKTPAKFGFMKGAIFSWTRRWHHIIKSGFTDTTGLEHTTYFKQRFIFPMLLHSKTAIVKRNDPDKMRTIWGCSKVWIIADTMIWWELIAWMKLNRGSSPMLWGYETFTGGWFRLNAELFSQFTQRSYVTIDWSRFDKRAYHWLMRRILLKNRDYLDFSQGYLPNASYPKSEGWNSNKSAALDRLYDWSQENLFNAPIVLPDGRMYKRNYAGLPSGLFTTQLLDSWYNYTLLAIVLTYLGYNLEKSIIKVQGDDSIIRLAMLIPPLEHDEFLLRMQGTADFLLHAKLSLDKSEIRNHLNGCEVLSYRNHHGLPYRDELSMLAQFYHTKAKDPTPQITMAQAIGFAYAACGHHRRIHELLESVYYYYRKQGYSPNPAGLSIVFGDSPDRPSLPFNADHFPTLAETRAYLMDTDYRNTEQDARTWPMTYFLYPPCSRP